MNEYQIDCDMETLKYVVCIALSFLRATCLSRAVHFEITPCDEVT